jgi:redox-sensitive bicupin YhaK (pirin superfamily)
MHLTARSDAMKKVLAVQPSPPGHWVGDGFPVRTVFSSQSLGPRISPFLLLDHAGPARFPPSDKPRGVEEHPHRGFETVTIVYQGELEHRDSAGNHGRIGPGDVQWMTAASGVVHEEKHAEEFTRRGGTLEMVQLWVNLPRSVKMSPPRYQTLLKGAIPVAELPDGGGHVRVIAGAYEGIRGPARTFTPINLYDLRLSAGHQTTLALPEGYNTGVLVLAGGVTVNGSHVAKEAEFVVFDPRGEHVSFDAKAQATLLLLNGEPIDEPVVAYGPFVMNTQDEVRQAIQDYQSGRMGHITPVGS